MNAHLYHIVRGLSMLDAEDRYGSDRAYIRILSLYLSHGTHQVISEPDIAEGIDLTTYSLCT